MRLVQFTRITRRDPTLPPIDHSKHSVGFTGLALWVYAALWVSGRVGGIRCGCFAWVLLRRWVNSVAEQQPQQTNSSFQFAECGKVSLESFSRCLFELVEILQYLDFNRGDLWIFTVTVNACQTFSFDVFNLHLIHDEFYIS